MKAWYVHHKEDPYGEEGGGMVFALTRGQAKMTAFRSPNFDWEGFTDIRVRREPRADGEPHELSGQEWLAMGYSYPCDWCLDEIVPTQEWVEVGGALFHAGCGKTTSEVMA